MSETSGYYFACCHRWFPENHHFCLAAMKRVPLPELPPGPQRYRKLPIVVEAMQFITGPNLDVVSAWCGGQLRVGRPDSDRQIASLVIHTLEGDMTASEGDWIVRGPKGEFYPVKPRIFAATYEEA